MILFENAVHYVIYSLMVCDFTKSVKIINNGMKIWIGEKNIENLQSIFKKMLYHILKNL